MRHHVEWVDNKVPVYIELGYSVEEILKPGYITAQIKSLKVLGVMLDADKQPASRYLRIRDQCRSLFPNLPETLPSDGVAVENDGRRFGVWIMPDNGSPGTLETFLKYLVPNASSELWEHAKDSVKVAKGKGAKCRECHDDKANLYTWLAWQDPPGYSPGIALTKKVLDPNSQSAASFVNWFRELYQL
jgi:hypothetical protein